MYKLARTTRTLLLAVCLVPIVPTCLSITHLVYVLLPTNQPFVKYFKNIIRKRKMLFQYQNSKSHNKIRQYFSLLILNN